MKPLMLQILETEMEASPINSMILGKTEFKDGDRQTLGFGDEGDPSPTISTAHQHAAAIKNPTQYIVRRLTPKECERLMGYPDDYTIPMFAEITDELVEEFVTIHNDFNALMSDKPVKPKTHKQVRKWLETISNPETCSDAPRYKVCGNGWAINCARWVLQGVDQYLKKERNTKQ